MKIEKGRKVLFLISIAISVFLDAPIIVCDVCNGNFLVSFILETRLHKVESPSSLSLRDSKPRFSFFSC